MIDLKTMTREDRKKQDNIPNITFAKAISPFVEQVKKEKNTEETPSIELDLNSMVYSDSQDILSRIDSMSEADLDKSIKGSIGYLLSEQGNDTFFEDKRVLRSLCKVVSSKKFSRDENCRINNIFYNYFVRDNANPAIKEMMLAISATINKAQYQGLLSLGLYDTFCKYMVVSRNASNEEFINANNINFMILTSDPGEMTLQMILFIYEKLFDHLTPVFSSVMLMPIPDNDNDPCGEIFSAMTIAVLDLVNNMPSIEIKKLLVNYAELYKQLSPDIYKPNFNIRGLSGDYGRILNTIEELRMENIILP